MNICKGFSRAFGFGNIEYGSFRKGVIISRRKVCVYCGFCF